MVQPIPMDEPEAEQESERGSVPRVVHLGYFDAVLDGVRAGLTYDELRVRLITVSNDLARFNRQRLPSLRTDPTTFWFTTRAALEGLMQCGFVETQPLPSRKGVVDQHADRQYRLTAAGRELLSLPGIGAQREQLGRALYQEYGSFRRYLKVLERRSLFFPELTETELERLGAKRSWRDIAHEAVNRAAASEMAATYDVNDLAEFIENAVSRRFSRRSASPWARRKDLQDTVLAAISSYVAHAEDVDADAKTVSVVHEWARQLFLIGSSRYVASQPGGLLQWSAASIEEANGRPTFVRRVLPGAAESVVQAIGTAYLRLLRPGTRLVEYFRLRGTAGYIAGVTNDLVDRVVAAMVTGQLSNPYGLQPAAGAQWTPPASERPLRIGDRRYTLVSFTREVREVGAKEN